MKNINPEIEGVYLCKVRGKKYCNYEVLRYSKNDGWWQYYKDYSRKDSDIEGWVGLDSKVTVESFQLIEKDAKQSKKSLYELSKKTHSSSVGGMNCSNLDFQYIF